MTIGSALPPKFPLIPLVIILLFGVSKGLAQDPYSLKLTEVPPKDLLSTRSVVIFDYRLSLAELQEIQKSFQQIGIDAVAFFDEGQVMSGKDATKAFADYFVLRQITNLIFVKKLNPGYYLMITPFNQKPTLFNKDQYAWQILNPKLNELLRTVFQDSWRSQRKQNFLINDYPETDIVINMIRGNRQEFYAIDLKVDNLAVVKFGDEKMDKDLEAIFLENYPLKYKLVAPGQEEQDLRRQGFNYILCFVHTRGSAAKEILGYQMAKRESAFASVTFPAGQLQLKTIPADTSIYKFYFKHIDNGNVFLGTKWDADISWQDALKNQITGFKIEARIN